MLELASNSYIDKVHGDECFIDGASVRARCGSAGRQIASAQGNSVRSAARQQANPTWISSGKRHVGRSACTSSKRLPRSLTSASTVREARRRSRAVLFPARHDTERRLGMLVVSRYRANVISTVHEPEIDLSERLQTAPEPASLGYRLRDRKGYLTPSPFGSSRTMLRGGSMPSLVSHP